MPMGILTGLVAFHNATGALTGLVANRAYPTTTPQNAVKPYYIFQRVSTPQRAASLTGDSALEQSRYQFTVVANTALEADTIAEALKTALLGYKGTMGDRYVSGITLGGDIDDFEPTTQTYRRIVDFLLWHRANF